MNEPKKINGWHFLTTPGKLRDGSPAAKVGEMERYSGPVKMCETGLHASIRLTDALRYAPGSFLRRVVLTVSDKQSDKSVGTERLIEAEADILPQIVQFTQWCAEQAKQHSDASADAASAASRAHADADANAAAAAAERNKQERYFLSILPDNLKPNM